MSQEHYKITNGCPEYLSSVVYVSSCCFSLSYKDECHKKLRVNLFSSWIFWFLNICGNFVLNLLPWFLFVTLFLSQVLLPSHPFNHTFFCYKENHNIYRITFFLSQRLLVVVQWNPLWLWISAQIRDTIQKKICFCLVFFRRGGGHVRNLNIRGTF